jgi:type IV secretion system protein VirD4
MRFLAVAALLVLAVGGCWFATQYVASALAYAPALGPPWATLGEERLYAPWQWIVWGRLYAPRASILFRNAGAMTTASALAGAAAAAMAALRRKPSAHSRAHGSSRWATTAEMKRAGLLQGAGVVLCQTDDAEFRTTLDSAGRTRTRCTRLGALVRHDGPEHVFCFAPTRSGKGVGLVIPTLLSWPHSVLVYDIKKENWALTAGWRRQFSRTWRFEPTSMDSMRFNPLLEIRKGLSEVRDTQNVADILVDPTGEKETRDHWQATAHDRGSARRESAVTRTRPQTGPSRGRCSCLRFVRSSDGDPGVHRVRNTHRVRARFPKGFEFARFVTSSNKSPDRPSGT